MVAGAVAIVALECEPPVDVGPDPVAEPEVEERGGRAVRLEDDACEVTTSVTYDIYSLGWLVKYFLRHHPEIQLGVFPGTVLTILDSLRIAGEAAYA